MNARKLIPIVILVAVAAVAVAHDTDSMEKMEGEVLMLTPAVLQLASDQGMIEDFEITPDSEIEDGVVRGDRVTVYFNKTGESKVIVSSERLEQGRTEAATVSRGSQQPARTAESEGRAAMGAETTRQQERTGSDQESWYDKEGTPYNEAVNPPDNAIIGRQGPMMLPDTASALPAAGLLGLAALAAATAVGMLRRRI